MVRRYWFRIPELASDPFFIGIGNPTHQIAQLGHELASTIVIVISKSGGTLET